MDFDYTCGSYGTLLLTLNNDGIDNGMPQFSQTLVWVQIVYTGIAFST